MQQRIAIIFLLLQFSLNSCKNEVKQGRQEYDTTIFEIKQFKEIMASNHDDSVKSKELLYRHFSMIGEESFLKPNQGDFYLIYQETKPKFNCDIYSLKRINGLMIASHRSINNITNPVLNSNASNVFSTYSSISKSQVIHNGTLLMNELIFRFEEIHKKISPNKLDKDNGDNFHELFIYKEGNYQYISSDLLSDGTLDSFKEIFRNKEEYKGVIDLDSFPDKIFVY